MIAAGTLGGRKARLARSVIVYTCPEGHKHATTTMADVEAEVLHECGQWTWATGERCIACHGSLAPVEKR